MKSSVNYENYDLSKLLSQNSFFPPTPENDIVKHNDINNDEKKFSVINRIELLKESLIDVISNQGRYDSNQDNIEINYNNIFNDSNSIKRKIFSKNINDNYQYTQNIKDIEKKGNNSNKLNNNLPISHNISQDQSYLNLISINNKKNIFVPKEEKLYNKNIIKNYDSSFLRLSNIDDHYEKYISNSLISSKSISAIEQKSINTDIRFDSDINSGEDEIINSSPIKTNKTCFNSSITYDKSTFMSNKTYVNSFFDKSNCNINTIGFRKVLGEINNVSDSKDNTLKKEDEKYLNKDNNDVIILPINNYQLSKIKCKNFPKSFNKVLKPKILNDSDEKKSDSFSYNGFIDSNNDPFNSKLEDIDVFSRSNSEQDQEPTKNKVNSFDKISNNINLDSDIEKNCESSFIDLEPYDLYKKAFYNENDFDLSSSDEFYQKKHFRNTILTKDVIKSLSSTTSSTSSFDSSIRIKKVDLDIRFTEDNQIKAEHIANMTPGTFFGMRSAPLGCLDGESLTPSQRPLFKYFTPESESPKNYHMLNLLSESNNSVISINEIDKYSNIFENISEISEISIFESKNKEESEEVLPIKCSKEEFEIKSFSKNNLLNQKINNQTLVFLSTIMEQSGYDQHKYFIDFGDVKISTRKCWYIVFQCNIVKVINWQLTQEKTIFEKKFMKDGNEFIQNHTLDIDAFSINYTHGKINPDTENTIVLSFFPTAMGKYYKKITIIIGKHKILFTIEGNGVSGKTVNITNNMKISKQNKILNETNKVTKSNNNNNNKYLILNDEAKEKKYNQELPITFESINNNIYSITFNIEKKLLFESYSKEKIICFNIKRLLFNKVYNLKINNTSNIDIKIYFNNKLNDKNSKKPNNFYAKFPDIEFSIPSKKCCFVPFKLFYNKNNIQDNLSFYTYINCNNISRKILISYKKTNFKSSLF
ncbi:hypothetical protein U3516DRAFT_851513 [Neocallimastix sp. 'constans']